MLKIKYLITPKILFYFHMEFLIIVPFVRNKFMCS